MSQKPDFYEVLGVEKTAGEEQIKKAHAKIMMRCHPDVVRNKQNLTEQQKEEAVEKFKWANEAEKVLLDPVKRRTYDNFGHKGLENLENGQSNGPSQTWEQAAGPIRPMRHRDIEDIFDRFERARDEMSPEDAAMASGTTISAEEARRRRLAARRARRGGPQADVAEDFDASAPRKKDDAPRGGDTVVDTVAGAADKLRTATGLGAEINPDVLQQFRDSLQTLMKEVDRALDRVKSRRHDDPRP